MKCPGRFLCICFAFSFAFPAFAREPQLAAGNKASKELKRTAHHLRIPVEQLENARQALQEATDLAKNIEPSPVDKLQSLVHHWAKLNPPKEKAIIDSFIQDLRVEAAMAEDFESYIRATSAAMNLIQLAAGHDYEKMRQLIRSWPEPQVDTEGNARQYLDNIEARARSMALNRLANSDPEKALDLISQSGDSGGYNYSITGQIARSMMNEGRTEEAFGIIDQTIGDFKQHAEDPRALVEYENFVRLSLLCLDSSRIRTALNPLITELMSQPPSGNCRGSLMGRDTSLDLTCAESKILSLLRSFTMMPEFIMTTLDSLPELKSKLNSVGGIDGYYRARIHGGSGMNYITPAGSQSKSSSTYSERPDDPNKLFRELKGKAETNPSSVKSKLESAAKGPESINLLISLAGMASYQDPELGGLALEIAQRLLQQVEPLEKRSAMLQSLVRAYRQIEGEADPNLLKDGFIIADQLREQLSEKNGMSGGIKQSGRNTLTTADRLEVFLISELSRDSFEKAINYVRAMENNAFKFECLVHIVQAQGQPNY
jgi:hypothetical protein